MSTEAVHEAMSRLLNAGADIERKVALGQLLEHLVRTNGQPADRLGMVAAVTMMLWQASGNGEEGLQAAGDAAKKMLFLAKPSPAELTRLAAVGRTLLGAALSLQGELLLAAEAVKYVPQEGDLAIWLGKHVVHVEKVDTAAVVDSLGGETIIGDVWIKTAGHQRIPVSARELELYHREGHPPNGDYALAGE